MSLIEYRQGLCEISPGTPDLPTDALVAWLPEPSSANSAFFLQTTPTSSFLPLTGGGEHGVFGRSEAPDVGLQALIGEACGRRFRGRVFRASGTSARRRGGFLWSPTNAAPVFLNLCSGCPGAAGGRG